MLVFLSPAKTMDFQSPLPLALSGSTPAFIREARELNGLLQSLTPREIQSLMKIKPALAETTHAQIRNFTPSGIRPALFAYTGLVFKGIRAYDFTQQELSFAQKHLRILSGLYGILQPTDLICPYRLEMKTSLPNKDGKNLYQFWQTRLTEYVSSQESQLLLNLASTEYNKAIDLKKFPGQVVSFRFLEGERNVATYAKQARGQMLSFIVRKQITSLESLKEFDATGYAYWPQKSSEQELVFVRNPE